MIRSLRFLWCVKQAGATAEEFRFSARHADYVHKFIKNADLSVGVFRGHNVKNYSSKVGDIIQNNKNGNSFDFQHARSTNSYESHCAIVTEVGIDNKGLYAITIGGNESDSIRTKEIRLDKNGKIIQRSHNPYISVIETLK